MNKFATSAAVLALTALAALPASADVIYGTTAIGASPRTSDYGTADNFGYRTFDNFTSANNASIERLSWRGIWFGDQQPAPAPDPLVDTWQVAFHSSSGGHPGAVVWSQDVAAASVTSIFRGTGVLNAGASYNANFYDYSFDLSSALSILGGQEYWVTVTAVAANFNPMFAILGATGGDDNSWQQQLGAGMSVTSEGAVARDRAFTIEGAVFRVPEPGTLALVGLALGALAVRRRPSRA